MSFCLVSSKSPSIKSPLIFLLNLEDIILIKIYLSISKENQELRFHLREINPLKYWKLSPNDWKSHKNWQVLTKFKEYMFKHTSTEKSPWVIINSDNKMIARLNAMRYVLSHLEYEGKEKIKIKDIGKNLRLCLTGSGSSIDLIRILDILGIEEIISRLSYNVDRS